jgi:hypothetical protein
LDTSENTYKITHYYSRNHEKYSVFVQTEINLPQFIDILGAIIFKFEELVPEQDCMDEQHLISILTKFFNVKDVTKKCQGHMKYTRIPLDQWEITNTFLISDNPTFVITQIDLYEVREFCNGIDLNEKMENLLPQSKEFELEIRRGHEFYYSRVST